MFDGYFFKLLKLAIWLPMGLAARAYMKLAGARVGRRLTMFSLPYCRVHKGSDMTIGDDAAIMNRLVENPAAVFHRTVLITAREGASLTIGDHVGISGAVLYCSRQITIGNHVKIGAGAMIYDTDHHPTDWWLRRHEYKDILDQIPSAAVVIQDDVWIGARAIILKGVTIGRRSVVACGAVVTHDVPSDCLVAGVPARVVKTLPQQQ
jgi:acetyltransferase-like isoleucine patch superfamily enzyme